MKEPKYPIGAVVVGVNEDKALVQLEVEKAFFNDAIQEWVYKGDSVTDSFNMRESKVEMHWTDEGFRSTKDRNSND